MGRGLRLEALYELGWLCLFHLAIKTLAHYEDKETQLFVVAVFHFQQFDYDGYGRGFPSPF